MTITLNGSSGITTSTTGNSSIILDAGTGSASANQESYIDFKLDGTLKSTIKVTEATSGNPLEFHTGGAQRVVIDSSGNVGIGTTTPSSILDVYASSSVIANGDNRHLVEFTSGTNNGLDGGVLIDSFLPRLILNDSSTSAGYTDFRVDGNGLIIAYGSNTNKFSRTGEYMRIDSSGNLVVGKTAIGIATVGGELRADGQVTGTRDGGVALALNRKTSDGDIALFAKDGTTVGSIGAKSGSLLLGSIDTYLRINDPSDTIFPSDSAGLERDNAINLGKGSSRFKDLYLSGTIQIQSGTGNIGVGVNTLNSNSGNYNTAVGLSALYSNTTASNNTAVGYQAAYTQATGSNNVAFGYRALYTDNTGTYNTALGYEALKAQTAADSNTGVGAGAASVNTTGTGIVAIGRDALGGNTTGSYNTAVGQSALISNTTSNTSTAIGYQALKDNTSASMTAVGAYALKSHTSGVGSVAVGESALTSQTTGGQNVAVGNAALLVTTTSTKNVAVGYSAGFLNSTAWGGTFVGWKAGYSNQTGNTNTYIGNESGYNSTGSNNVFVGSSTGYNSTGSQNTFVGWPAGLSMTTGSNNTILGSFNGNQNGLDIRTSSNNIVLSDGSGNPKAWWDSAYNCKLRMGSGGGTNTMKYNTSTYEVTFDTSSARYKENIRDSIYGLNAVLSLSAKQFEYKKDGRSDIGLIAEEVVSVIPELVGTDADGRPDSVTYDRMVSVLVKAIQELSAKNDALEARLAALENA